MIDQDIAYAQKILPKHYLVQESYKKKGCVWCQSPYGIYIKGRHGIYPDEEHWYYIFSAFMHHYDDRFQEIKFNNDLYYQDFTIYLKKK